MKNALPLLVSLSIAPLLEIFAVEANQPVPPAAPPSQAESAKAKPKPEAKPKADPNLEAGKRALSVLEAVANWQPLFNGRDLNGWRGDTTGHIVKDGVLVCQKGAKNLETEKPYGDFAFCFEFKLEESGNNGIGIRVPAGGHPAKDGMEIQILDHSGSRYTAEADTDDGKKRTFTWLKPWQMHGSIYGVVPARTDYLKPVGEWNSETIIAIEDHIMVILNGAVIVDAFLEDVTPFDGHDRTSLLNRTGHISFAGHSDYMEFRNIKLADFSPPPPLIGDGKDNTPPPGFTPLFNGKDLTGWKGLTHQNANDRRALAGEALVAARKSADEKAREHWKAVDGILTYDGKGQSLCTERDYGDFEMYVDWKIPSGADSGIYLRGTPQIQIWDPWDLGKVPENPCPDDLIQAWRTGRNLGSGSLWNNKRARNTPLVLADKKPGEWNTFLIRMVGDKVTIWLNGKLVVDRTRLENYWDEERRKPLPRADQIELQHHGSELFFKNIYLRELPY